MAATQVKEAKPFGRGISTEPDVERLMRKYGAPKPGVIYWKDIERVLQMHRQMSRFFTVVRAWQRKLMEEYNIAMDAMPGEGLRVLDEDQRVYSGATRVHRSVRGVLRAHEFVSKIDSDKLSDEVSQRRLNQVMKASKAMLSVATDSVRAMVAVAGKESPKELKK